MELSPSRVIDDTDTDTDSGLEAFEKKDTVGTAVASDDAGLEAFGKKDTIGTAFASDDEDTVETGVDNATDLELEASEDEDRELKTTLRRSPRIEQKSQICLMLLTLLPKANAFQGIIGAPEDWVHGEENHQTSHRLHNEYGHQQSPGLGR